MSEDLPTSKRDWMNLFAKGTKAALVGVASLFVTLLAYAATAYVRDVARSEALSAVTPLTEIPAKVQTLEEFKGRQEEAQRQTVLKLEEMNARLVRIESTSDVHWNTQIEQIRRVIDQLDRMERRSSSSRPGSSSP